MKVYKLTVMVIDYDEIGDRVSEVLKNGRFGNRCINPVVMGIESRDIGEWSDANPLNSWQSRTLEFKRLFAEGKA